MKNIKYISASAGSGKTYRLTEELTNAIKRGAVQPENVILTTFTKAAASEFKDKAKAMLYENGLVTEANRLDQALIGTIHSVAQTLILKYWYYLGLSPDTTPIAEEEQDFYRNQSLANILTDEEQKFLRDFAEEFRLLLSKSAHYDYDFWKNHLTAVLEYTRNYQINDYGPSIEYSKEMTRSLVHGGYHLKVNLDLLEEILNQAIILNEKEEADNQVKLRKDLDNQKRWMSIKNPSSIRYVKEITEFVKKLPWKELKQKKADFINSLTTPYASEEVRETLNEYIDMIFSLAKRWSQNYKDYKTEHHLIDFADMEVYFDELLNNKEVAEDIRATYKYVFVDEFQDCSPIQVKIFAKLSEIVDHSIWVGDKKQAIYGFRGSDTKLTTTVMDIIKDNEKKGIDNCETDILHFSWRSLPKIVDFTNEFSVKAFSQDDRDSVTLTSKREDGKGFVGYWWLEGTNKETRGPALAANIAELINNGETPSDIAILARSNDELEDIAGYLREKNIPVYLPEGGDSSTNTVSLVKALLQLVADETAELPKAEIAFLTEKNYKLGKIFDDKLEYNATGSEDTLFYEDIPLIKSLLAEIKTYKLLSIAALVETLIIELDLYNVAKKLNDSADSAKILHAIIDSAVAYEDYCALMHLPSSIMGFIAFLSEKGISVSGSTEGVQLFTYHGSKGLEWKTVLLLSCEQDLFEDSKFIKWNILGTRLIRTKSPTKSVLFPEVIISVLPNLFHGKTSIPDEWLTPIQASKRYKDLVESTKEETKRLLYVAMTRPRDKLIIVLKGKRGEPEPMLTFSQLGYNVSKNFQEKTCDLLGVGIIAQKINNADFDVEYNHEEEEDCVLKISSKPAKNPQPRDLKPSSMEGGQVNAKLVKCGNPITVAGKYDTTTLGICIHDIFCVADQKNDTQIADMVKAYGFESNLPNVAEIKKSWLSLTEWLSKNYGAHQKQYHELPFKNQLATGQIVTGSMDFVWETQEGCVLIDFKTFPGKEEDLLDSNSDYYAGNYKGQLECYEKALIAAGKKVLAKLLYYPVVGVVVEI